MLKGMQFGGIKIREKMEHDNLLELDLSARQAAFDGFYTTHSGNIVEWGMEIEKSINAKVSIPPEKQLNKPKDRKYKQTHITVENITTTAASKTLYDKGEKPLALNFANGYTPGGGFLNFGCRAQEEVLCRMSALYQTIEKDPMYDYHEEKGGCESSSWAILSPNVPVFRDDDYNPLNNIWPLSFITCAAPEADIVGQPKSTTLLRKRIHRILEIAESFNYSSLVLGAWGCGAFGNNPGTTALDFKYALRDHFKGAFKTVVFAVYDRSGSGENLVAFQNAFK